MIAPPLNRIPGTAQTKEKYSKDLKTLAYHELLEMKQRQTHLLACKKRMQSLPDKGKRIQDYYDKILAEIQRRNDVEATADLLGELNIASKGKTKLNNLEWLRNTTAVSSNGSDVLDSDDEQDIDPLRIVAQGTMHQKQIKLEPLPATLITPQDLADIASFRRTEVHDSLDSIHTDQSASSSVSGQEENKVIPAEIIEVDVAKLAGKLTNEQTLEQHALYLIDKTELKTGPPEREKFRPFRTTVSNVHDPEKERMRKKGKHWEVTAATPPLIQHKEIQLVPLTESANLQISYMQKIKELRIQQAEQRLARQTTGKLQKIRLPEESVLKTKASFNSYRDPKIDYLIEGRQCPNEEKEVFDPTIAETATGGISYSVFQ